MFVLLEDTLPNSFGWFTCDGERTFSGLQCRIVTWYACMVDPFNGGVA